MLHSCLHLKSKNILFASLLFFSPLFLFAQSGACPTSLADISTAFGDPDGTDIAFENDACVGVAPGDPGAGLSATGESLGGTVEINGETYASQDVCDGSGREVYSFTGAPGDEVDFPPTYQVVFTVGASTETCSYNASGQLILVPTLSEWGLIILGLLILTVGVVYANASSMQLANGQTVQTPFSLKSFSFERSSFVKNLAIILGLGFVGFMVAIYFFGYEMTNADPFGAVVASAILAYLVMTLKMQEDKK